MKEIKLSNVKKVARWEFFKTVRSPAFLILTFIMPLIMIIAGSIGFLSERMGTETHIKIAVVDENGDFFEAIQKYLYESTVSFERFDTNGSSISDLDDLVKEGVYEGFVLINNELLQNASIVYYTKDIRDVSGNILSRELNSVFHEYKLDKMGFSDEEKENITTNLNLKIKQIDGEEFNLATVIIPVLMGLGLIIAVLFSGQVMMYGVIKEKQNRIVEILLSSISSFDLLMGKLIGFGLLSLLQMLIWFLVGGFLAFGVFNVPGFTFGVKDIIVPLLFFFFGYFMLSSLFAAIGATMKEAEGGSQIQGMFILIPMLPLFVAAPLFMYPNALWARIISHVPPFIPAMMLIRIGATDIALWEIVTTLTALILSTFLFIALGAKIFKSGIMKYDKAMGFKELKAALTREK